MPRKSKYANYMVPKDADDEWWEIAEHLRYLADQIHDARISDENPADRLHSDWERTIVAAARAECFDRGDLPHTDN